MMGPMTKSNLYPNGLNMHSSRQTNHLALHQTQCRKAHENLHCPRWLHVVHVAPACNRTLSFIYTPSTNMLCQKSHFFLPETHLLTCMLKHSLRFWRTHRFNQNHEEHGRIPETKLLEKCKHFKEKGWLQLNLHATRRWTSNMLPEESSI